MSELHEECGVAAIYHLPERGVSALCPEQGPEEISRLMPRMLLDIQNRGQLAAGITTYNPMRQQLIDTFKDVGSVNEVFSLSHRSKYDSIMREYGGRAAIGHVRYATCGMDDRSYAQPFERHHIKKHKWFSFAFNGQLANYMELREELLDNEDNHLSRETDTEIFMHQICAALSTDVRPPLINICRHFARKFDGAYSIAFIDALGSMMVARDPLGIKPLCYAVDGPLFAAASESVALLNLGITPEKIKPVPPGHAITITDGELEILPFTTGTAGQAGSGTRTFTSGTAGQAGHRPTMLRTVPVGRGTHAHCFFEWIYFANVASTLDGRSVYLSRKALGEELARLETLPIDSNTVVVPVPDTSKAAADAMAYALKIPCVEGLIRNRYSGRTFIEGGGDRKRKAETKYTPLREVLDGKRVILVEDSIVRATTLRVLLRRLRQLGRPKEIHVRVACPPIIGPCFYGIDMSTISELFAPHFLHGEPITPAVEAEMAAQLGADSLRYLPVDAIARAIGLDADNLCRACITGQYPTPCGQHLAQVALENFRNNVAGRTYETAAPGSH